MNSELSLNFCAQSASAAGGLGLLSSYERLTVVALTAFFDSKLRLAVMASKTDCCRELSRGRQALEAASVFFSRHLLMAMADWQRRLKDNTIFHVDIAKSQH